MKLWHAMAGMTAHWLVLVAFGLAGWVLSERAVVVAVASGTVVFVLGFAFGRQSR